MAFTLNGFMWIGAQDAEAPKTAQQLWALRQTPRTRTRTQQRAQTQEDELPPDPTTAQAPRLRDRAGASPEAKIPPESDRSASPAREHSLESRNALWRRTWWVASIDRPVVLHASTNFWHRGSGDARQ